MGYSNPADQRQYQLSWMRRRRADWIAEHGPCAECGSSAQLEVDHIDPATKAMQPSRIWSLTAAKREAELAKCQVLCRECHRRKTSLSRGAKHGTASRYRRGCHCDACREAQRLKGAEDRRKKKARLLHT